jgi:VanZ family protein
MSKKIKVTYLLASIAITCTIVLLSSIPEQSLPGAGTLTEQILSNLAHIPAYGVLAYAWLKSFGITVYKEKFPVTMIGVLMGLVLFSISDEILQSFVPGRTPSLMDIGLDLLGICVGLTVLQNLQRRSFPPKRNIHHRATTNAKKSL